MAYFSKEDIVKAKEIDLYSYLKSYDPEELIYDSKGTYTTKTHDSLKISNGMWYWFSRGIGGKTALEYLIKVKNYSFTEAVSHLLGTKGIVKNSFSSTTLNEKIFILPQKDKNNNKAIAYLKSRGIDNDIIFECINNDFLYQDIHKNVVFVGYDNKCYPRYAGIRGTNNSRFMYEISGSDKSYSFKLNINSNNNSVHLFESAIDLLSYATLKKINNETWYNENLLSLAGIYKPAQNVIDSKTPKTLANFLKNNPKINTIFLHLDNDNAGRLATLAIKTSLSDSYKIIDEPPKIGKDFNDFLCYKLKINSKNYNNYYR